MAIHAELNAGRSGRPWREAVLHELRGLRNDMRAEKDRLPAGMDHLPLLGEDQRRAYDRALREQALERLTGDA